MFIGTTLISLVGLAGFQALMTRLRIDQSVEMLAKLLSASRKV